MPQSHTPPKDGQKSNSQRPHKLHPPHPTQQLRRRPIHARVLRPQADAEEPADDLDVAAFGKPVRRAHELDVLFLERDGEFLHFFEEHDDLVGGPAGDVARLGREARFAGSGGESFPLVGERVADVYQGGVEGGLGREARLVEPLVPVQFCEGLGGGGVGGEEFEHGRLEVVGVKRLLFVLCKVLGFMYVS